MRIKPRDVPAPPAVPTPREVADAQVDAFRDQWRAVRRQAKVLAGWAEEVVAATDGADFRAIDQTYRELFAATYREVNLLVGMATRLTPLARDVIERGVGPLFEADGALSPWFRGLWLESEAVKQAARIRRMKARV